MFLFLILASSLSLSSCGCSPTAEGGDAKLSRSGMLPMLAAAETDRAPLSDADRRLYLDAATAAWRFLDSNYEPATGFVNATPDWNYATIWDIGGQLLAFHSAHELGFLDAAEYDRRTRRALTTLERAPLFRGAAYNKTYSTRDGSMGTGRRSGTGWSATDLGRLLVALKVVATREPQHAAQAERIVRRIDFTEVVRGGYLHGQLIGNSGRPWTFQEGRIGYEQYAAKGFELWGASVGNALDLSRNGEPVEVEGVRLLRDRRWQDRLVSEPFVLMGLELGYSPDYRQLAAAMLAAQEARYRSTGQITIVSEDALTLPPHYFYYYCVYCNRHPFVVDSPTPGTHQDIPRWVSTKAAFAWHAVLPNDYTRKALEHVQRAKHPQRGWASGVFEGNGASTNTYDINTAAVILEVAAFQLRGARPLIEPPVRSAATAAAPSEGAHETQ